MGARRGGGALGEIAEALLDLVLPGGCAGCGEPAGLLCVDCAEALGAPARPAWPVPAPPDLPPPWAVATYAGPVRAMVLAHKEDGRLALARPLGDALARAVRAALVAPPGQGRRPVTLVPVPSRRAAVRARGHDPTLRMARRAAVTLRHGGIPVRVAPVVRPARGLADQAGLDAAARAANLAGALAVPPRWARLVAGRPVVVLDDVVTTGASLAETARVLRVAGAEVVAAAVVGATARRSPPDGRPALSLRTRRG